VEDFVNANQHSLHQKWHATLRPKDAIIGNCPDELNARYEEHSFVSLSFSFLRVGGPRLPTSNSPNQQTEMDTRSGTNKLILNSSASPKQTGAAPLCAYEFFAPNLCSQPHHNIPFLSHFPFKPRQSSLSCAFFCCHNYHVSPAHSNDP